MVFFLIKAKLTNALSAPPIYKETAQKHNENIFRSTVMLELNLNFAIRLLHSN